jgi:hypothetical protein
MTSFDVVLYTSRKLRNYCDNSYGDPNRALKRAETYLKGAMNRVSGHYISVDYETDQIPAPIEFYKDSSGFTWNRCYTGETTYNWLQNWFRDYLACEQLPKGGDCTILLTSLYDETDGGVMATGDGIGVVCPGRYIAGLPSYFRYRGTSNNTNAADTLLHEFGHYAMGSVSKSHQRGDNYPLADNGFPTTLSNGLAYGDANACGQGFYPESTDGQELIWDDCCTNLW